MAGNPELIAYYGNTHAERVYGTSSVKYLRFLRPEIKLLHPHSIIDYGCGQSRFLDELDLGYPFKKLRFDPAIPDFAEPPREQADLLVSIDVLEHIEEDDLDEVIADMRRACRNAIIIIDTKPAKHRLPDGRNAHVTLRAEHWWRQKLSKHFASLSPLKTKRRSRAGFKTWTRSFPQTFRFRALRAGEDVVYYSKRLVRRHKVSWKKSALEDEQ